MESSSRTSDNYSASRSILKTLALRYWPLRNSQYLSQRLHFGGKKSEHKNLVEILFSQTYTTFTQPIHQVTTFWQEFVSVFMAIVPFLYILNFVEKFLLNVWNVRFVYLLCCWLWTCIHIHSTKLIWISSMNEEKIHENVHRSWNASAMALPSNFYRKNLSTSHIQKLSNGKFSHFLSRPVRAFHSYFVPTCIWFWSRITDGITQKFMFSHIEYWQCNRWKCDTKNKILAKCFISE